MVRTTRKKKPRLKKDKKEESGDEDKAESKSNTNRSGKEQQGFTMRCKDL